MNTILHLLPTVNFNFGGSIPVKQIDKMSRLTGQLEKCFRLLNDELFDGQLPQCMITVVPSARSYAHYTPSLVWSCKGDSRHEINISSAYLYRPLENILASLTHEMTHCYNDCVLNIQDTSNNGVYHNKQFKKAAEEHGLVVTQSEKYGWSHTEPGDRLLQFVLDHDELREIEMNRNGYDLIQVSIGTHASNGGSVVTPTMTKGHSRKWVCPQCGTIIRSNKPVRVICADCMQLFVEG